MKFMKIVMSVAMVVLILVTATLAVACSMPVAHPQKVELYRNGELFDTFISDGLVHEGGGYVTFQVKGVYTSVTWSKAEDYIVVVSPVEE
jgi:hypothetical protein